MAAVKALITKYQTKSGSRYRVRVSNRRLRNQNLFNRAGFNTKREAEAYARSVCEKVSRLENGDIELGRTFGELCDRYIEIIPNRLNTEDHSRRKQQIERWRSWIGGDVLLADVSPAKVSAILRNLAVQPPRSAPRGKEQPTKLGRTLSSSTVNRYRACLSAVFAYGVKELHWIDNNPVHSTRSLKESRGRIRYLEAEEIKRLGETVDTREGHLPLMFWLALTTGMRLGEIEGLQWSDVAFSTEGTATITLEVTKNGEAKVVPVTYRKAVRLLKEQKLEWGHTSQQVIPTSKGGNKHCSWYKEWRLALKKADIRDFRFHDLRHCFASSLAMQGLDGLQIADLTGHKSLAMVKRYAHLNPKSREANAAMALAGMKLSNE